MHNGIESKLWDIPIKLTQFAHWLKFYAGSIKIFLLKSLEFAYIPFRKPLRKNFHFKENVISIYTFLIF